MTKHHPIPLILICAAVLSLSGCNLPAPRGADQAPSPLAETLTPPTASPAPSAEAPTPQPSPTGEASPTQSSPEPSPTLTAEPLPTSPTPTPPSAASPVTAPSPPLDSKAMQVVTSINEWRIHNGLWPLAVNPMLSAMAAEQANYVAGLPDIPPGGDIHNDSSGQPPMVRALRFGWPHYANSQQVAVGENAYVGAGLPAALQFWKNSEIHRQTALSANFREIGVAVVPYNRMGFNPGSAIYMVTFGSRPNWLPALIDPQSGQLYLTTERYRFARKGGFFAEATSYQVAASGDLPAPLPTWQPWQTVIPLPVTDGTVFYIIYDDGKSQTGYGVNPLTDIAWLPDNLP